MWARWINGDPPEVVSRPTAVGRLFVVSGGGDRGGDDGRGDDGDGHDDDGHASANASDGHDGDDRDGDGRGDDDRDGDANAPRCLRRRRRPG